MMDRRLWMELHHVARRWRRFRLLIALAAAWLSAAVVGFGLLLWRRPTVDHSSRTVLVLAGLALAAAAVFIWLAVRRQIGDREVARRIEASHPELSSRLLAAIEQEPAPPLLRLGYLQDRVVRETLAHAACRDWRQTVPTRRLRTAHIAHFTALAGFAAIATALWFGLGEGSSGPLKNLLGSFSVLGGRYQVQIDPGDCELERGSSLLVLARFPEKAPRDAALEYVEKSADPQRMPMSRSLDDPLFGGRVEQVRDDLVYHVEFAGRRTRSYRVTVFEYPKLEQADAQLVFPSYTSLEEKRVEDTRSVAAVEGSTLTLTCRLNKPVASARLVAEDGESVELAAEKREAKDYRTTFRIEQSRRYTLELVDREGRKNQDPASIVVTAVANRRPDLKLTWPARDASVSALEELLLKASVWDDFGLRRYGLSYSLGGQTPREVLLGQSAGGRERLEVEHLLDFEDLDAAPDQLVSYYFWAEDADPDGQSRRTFSDMYFAEVRPFEEIFRQGQQPPGGAQQQQQQQQQGGQNAQAAEQLAQLQKQIVNGVWNVLRRETEVTPSEKFVSDSTLLRDSQQSALEQADALGQRLRDSESVAHLESVKRHMNAALEQLSQAVAGPSIAAHRPALASAQAAYQALLKLRARQHRVVRGGRRGQRGRQGGQNASGRSQMQLQQLELSNAENRYETERSASQPPNDAQQEMRQALNRLRELARRQQDLNKRLKELQSALEEAQTEQQREEIRRQLKRLREQQEEILRDTDQLSSRMERPINQERMADARQRLEQTRDQVRRAAEALRKGMVSQAAASGTRAGRQFEQLRDEFRKQAAGRFTEEMKQMLSDARRLDQKEQELADQLAGFDQFKAQSLREPHQREQVLKGLQQQQQELDDLTDRMRRTVEEAEQPEPLLSKRLYDTLRKTSQDKVGDALKVTEQLLQRGFLRDAAQQENVARNGIGELHRGVERAAESVLGDETEALRRAGREVAELSEQLDQEIASARGRRTTDRAGVQPPAPPNGQGAPATRPPRPESPESASTEPTPSQRSPGGNSARTDGSPQPPPASADRPSRPQTGPPNRGGRAANDGRGPAGGAWEQLLNNRAAPVRPLTGDGFRRWSDRLRDVEEMLDDTELRTAAARIRDRARDVRAEWKRRSKEPNWDLVREMIAAPLVELQQRIGEQLRRRSSSDSLTPIDRDPVPQKYAERVRRYYERLGSGE